MSDEITRAACAPAAKDAKNPLRARALRLLALSGALLFWSACASPPPTPAPPVEFREYRVGAPDVLQVAILPEPSVIQQLTVRPDGKITIQLVGDLQASGRTTQEISREIEQRIARYKRGAVVTVSLASAQSLAVTVLGEVRSNSTFPLTKQTRVAEAIGLVGGVTNFANADEIIVVRPGDPTAVMQVDLDAIRAGDLSTNIQLHGGDIVYVPPTVWARFGYAINAVLFPFQPLLGVANSVAGTAIVGN